MRKSLDNVAILGAGSWGTTLAVLLSKNDNLGVTLWSIFKKQAEDIKSSRINKEFLPKLSLPKKIKVTSNLGEALSSGLIILAIPVKYLRSVLGKIRKEDCELKDKILLSVAKGIEAKSLKRPTEIIKEQLGVKDVAVLSGPTIAREVAGGVPTVATVASYNKANLVRIQGVFKGSDLRVYRGHDIKGVELAGALKNIIAIACGISDGLGFGTNTKASLVTRGLVEITRLGKRLGADPSTFWGISGLGDLVTTCFSSYSRNRFVGERIGKGEKLSIILRNMAMVAEGIETVKSAYKLSKRLNVDMPITSEVFLVLYKNKLPKKAVEDLMARPLKAEKIG